RAAGGQAPHPGVLLGRAGESRLRRAGRGRRRAPGDAALPGARTVRPGPAGGDLRGDVGGLPRPAQGGRDRRALRRDRLISSRPRPRPGADSGNRRLLASDVNAKAADASARPRAETSEETQQMTPQLNPSRREFLQATAAGLTAAGLTGAARPEDTRT